MCQIPLRPSLQEFRGQRCPLTRQSYDFVKFEFQLHFKKTSVLFILLFGRRGEKYPNKVRGDRNRLVCHLKPWEIVSASASTVHACQAMVLSVIPSGSNLNIQAQMFYTHWGRSGAKTVIFADAKWSRLCWDLWQGYPWRHHSPAGCGESQWQNSPVPCSEAHSRVLTGQPEAAGTLQRNLPWSCGKDL